MADHPPPRRRGSDANSISKLLALVQKRDRKHPSGRQIVQQRGGDLCPAGLLEKPDVIVFRCGAGRYTHQRRVLLDCKRQEWLERMEPLRIARTTGNDLDDLVV